MILFMLETCASVVLFFFARRMLGDESRFKIRRFMELALHNGVLSGMVCSFFYVNPLSVNQEAVTMIQASSM